MSVVRALGGGDETGEKRSRFGGTLAGGNPGRLRSKSGTASKSSPFAEASQRLDAKSVFHFWNEAWVCVPKTFAFFSCFISTAFVFSPRYPKEPATTEKHISRRSD
ncbi:hypothetical protein EDM54_06930 [Brevibacillus borstelensis]|nr:hypothetical protein EDM54_06930 [Brevibacillus borstelensis]